LNANHSPFFSSDESNNPSPDDFSKDANFETYHNNRSTRLMNLIEAEDKVSYADFKRIKYDHQLPKPFVYSWVNINYLEKMNADQFPKIRELILRVQNWDRKATATSVGAGTYLMLYHKLRPYYDQIPDPKIIPTAILVKAFKEVKAHMLKHFGTTKVALGDYQKLVRGNKELPVFGIHYGDQMELYTQFKTKKMTFDKETIYANAERIYHPK